MVYCKFNGEKVLKVPPTKHSNVKLITLKEVFVDVQYHDVVHCKYNREEVSRKVARGLAFVE